MAGWPGPLRYNRASGSVVEACVSLLRFSPWKSRSPLRPGAGGSPPPSLVRKLFMLTQASISVPSSEKWSVRQQCLDRFLIKHCGHEFLGDVTLDQALAVLGEHRFVPHRLIQRQRRS